MIEADGRAVNLPEGGEIAQELLYGPRPSAARKQRIQLHPRCHILISAAHCSSGSSGVLWDLPAPVIIWEDAKAQMELLIYFAAADNER